MKQLGGVILALALPCACAPDEPAAAEPALTRAPAPPDSLPACALRPMADTAWADTLHLGY